MCALSQSFLFRHRDFGLFLAGMALVNGAISLDLFAVLLGGATALLPAFASDILHVGPEGFGLLRSGPALGAVLVALL